MKKKPFQEIRKFKIFESPFNKFIHFLNTIICNQIMFLLLMNISNIDFHGHSVIFVSGKQD